MNTDTSWCDPDISLSAKFKLLRKIESVCRIYHLAQAAMSVNDIFAMKMKCFICRTDDS